MVPELDWMDENIESGVLTVLMHPQVIGRGSRIGMLEQFIQHGLERGVRFQTMAQVATGLDNGPPNLAACVQTVRW